MGLIDISVHRYLYVIKSVFSTEMLCAEVIDD